MKTKTVKIKNERKGTALDAFEELEERNARNNNETASGVYYDGKFETIEYREYISERLTQNGLKPRQVLCICEALKYLSSRLGAKNDTPVELDLHKAENYIHRARTGRWMEDAK